MLVPNEKRPLGRPRKDIPDYSLMIEAAQLFYLYEMTRGEIAKRLHVDTRKVTDLLAQARQNEFVKIIVERDLSVEAKLERQLQMKYPHLERALIVASEVGGQPVKDVIEPWAEAAAGYFDELVKARAPRPLRVAVTGGDTLLAFVNAVPIMERPNLYVHVAALIGHGRLPEEVSHIDPEAVASILWARSGRFPGHCEFATVSPYDSKKAGPDALQKVNAEIERVEKNQVVREVVERMEDIDVVFGGVGIVNAKGSTDEKNRYTMEAYLKNIITPKALYDMGARGDYSYCTFGSAGERIDDLTFFLTPGHRTRKSGIDFFKNMVANAKHTGKKVVGFAGEFQLPALKIALEAGILNVVITDRRTAERLTGHSSSQK